MNNSHFDYGGDRLLVNQLLLLVHGERRRRGNLLGDDFHGDLFSEEALLHLVDVRAALHVGDLVLEQAEERNR